MFKLWKIYSLEMWKDPITCFQPIEYSKSGERSLHDYIFSYTHTDTHTHTLDIALAHLRVEASITFIKIYFFPLVQF